MARATWKGLISVGLVNIPVLLYSGEKRTDLQFNLLDVRDQNKVRYRRVNEETGEEVPWDQIVRAYEYSEGNYVMLEEEDFNRAAVESTKMIAIEAFVDRDEIKPYYFEKPYIVVPNKGGEKAYVLLREAINGIHKTGIGHFVLRGREYLVALMMEGDALMLNRMRFEQELVDPNNFDIPTGKLMDYGVTAQELDMAEKLVKAMGEDWQPEKYQDVYRQELLDWIDKKVRTGEVTPQEEEPEFEEEGEQENLMDLLQRSLEEVRG